MKNIGDIRFVSLLDVSESDLETVRQIRNHDDIRKYMYTDHLISKDEHANWVRQMRDCESVKPFVIYRNDKLIGFVSLSRISRLHSTAEWAFYLHPEDQGGGIGVAVEYALLEYAFGEIGISKLNCEVLELNPNVVMLHKKFGFQEEGFRRSNILKDGQRIGVHLLGLTAPEWEAGKSRLKKAINRHKR